MAVNSNIKIAKYDPMWLISNPIASATVVGVGDLISVESDLATVYNADADDATFTGLSMDYSANGDTLDLTTYGKCLAYVTLTAAATLGIGDKLEYVAGANGTNWTFEAGSTNPIAQSMQQLDTSSVGPILVAFDVQKYGIFT